MPHPFPFVKVNIEGHFGSSSTDKKDIWTAGFHVISSGGLAPTSAQLLAFFTAIDPFVNTFHTASNVLAGTNCWYDGISGALIGVDGHYAGGDLQPTTRFTRVTPTVGTGPGTAPWTQALVYTLRSLLLRGPASHGRFYYPALAHGVTASTGIIASAQVTGACTAAQTMLNAINGQISTSFGAATWVGLTSPVRTGFQSPVYQVGVGQRLDHMESRESTILEAHTFKPLTVATALLAERDAQLRERLDDELKVRPQ